MATKESISAQADTTLLKEITKLIHRIERILVPTNSLVHTTIGAKLDGLLGDIKKGKFFEDVKRFPVNDLIGYDIKSIEPLFRKVAWEKLGMAIWKTVNEGDETYILPDSVLNEIAMERQVHEDKLEKAANKEVVRRMQQRNGLPAISGKWRKEPYSARTYEFLHEYCVTENVAADEAAALKEQLRTPLDGYLGQSYNYDDHDLTEEWMVTFKDKGSAGPSDEDVIRTQLESLMEIMLFAVQDRVCSTTGVLQRPCLQLGKDVKEVPVWGIDCYTRRMVEMSIEDRVPSERRTAALIRKFVERRLLPTINDQVPSKAHDMTNSILVIIEDQKSTTLDVEYANAVLQAIREYTIDVFRIHPKGTGVVCINPAGIQPHVFVTEYLGEMYPSYRWCERLDVVEQAQKKFELKPTLPDFWNILLERPRQDPNGYGLLYVDASRKANLGSSCSHSCDSNCTSAVVARNGKLAIALTTNRYVHFGEELTMDYYSITTSDVEWRAAICLCGSAACRGSFLHYATQDDLQQVLNQSCGPLWRYASLLRACSDRPLSKEDSDVLVRHGMQSAALGPTPPQWMKKYAVDNLRFVEFERKALPCALLRSKDGSKSQHSFSEADMDARSVMEQRLQSMVCCFSMVQKVIERNNLQLNAASSMPLVPHQPSVAVNHVWQKLCVIADLLTEHLLQPLQFSIQTAHLSALQTISKSPVSPASSFAASASSLKENICATITMSTNGANTTSTGSGASSFAADMAQMEKSLEQKRAALKLVQKAMADINFQLEIKPIGLTKLREICLAMRAALLPIEHLSSAKVRINQLADILVLWAFTTNFSTVQHFNAVESGPIQVYARELGTNIPRNKIYKQYRGADHLSLRSRDKTQQVAISTSTSTAVSTVDYAAATVPATVSLSASGVSCETLDQAPMTCEASSCEIVPLDEDCTPLVSEPVIADGNTDQGSLVATVEDGTECSDAASAQASAAESSTEQSTEPSAEISSTTGGHSREPLLGSHETVFTGTMKYPELFTFWQLMGWFNAGTDQKTEAPDLFGCVELPEPTHCFGHAEIAYGLKQRIALIELLQDDKKQTMSWPPILKQSFTLSSTTASAPLYGSPMLDGALGQVGMVAKVIAILQERLPPSAVDGKKKKGISNSRNDSSALKSKGGKHKEKESKEEDKTQFDNILPPEMPTSWVQCEKCRKWRRVAWFVDSETLPDLWECTMNSWDPENATCQAPQDGYDPDAENTLGFGATEVLIDEDNFKVGKKFDLFCTRNKVYYEASVQKLKKNLKRPDEPAKVLFRFVGWGARYDEFVPINSDRIAPHNLHTNPATNNPREQEKWQGRKNLYDESKRTLVVSSTSAGSAGKKGSKASTESSNKRKRAAGKSVAKTVAKTVTKTVAKTSSITSARQTKTVSPDFCDDFEDLIDVEDGPINVSMTSEGDESSAIHIAGLFSEPLDEESPEKKAKIL